MIKIDQIYSNVFIFKWEDQLNNLISSFSVLTDDVITSTNEKVN